MGISPLTWLLPQRHLCQSTRIPGSENTEYAGLEVTVDCCITSSFSRQIANGNAGPALETWEQNNLFAAVLSILVYNVRTERGKKLFRPIKVKKGYK